MSKMEEEERSEGTLTLTIPSARDLKISKFPGKTKCYAIAWIDPRLKRSTKKSSISKLSWKDKLCFPLSLDILENPNACLTIQLLSASPIQRERLIGSAILSLREVRYHHMDFTLQVWRPSGRAQGLLCVSAWIDCDLRVASADGCVTGIPVEFSSEPPLPPPLFPDQTNLAESEYALAVPSAPAETYLIEEPSSIVDRTMPVESGFSTDVPSARTAVTGSSDLTSLLIGFVGGAVTAAAIVLARKR